MSQRRLLPLKIVLGRQNPLIQLNWMLLRDGKQLHLLLQQLLLHLQLLQLIYSQPWRRTRLACGERILLVPLWM